MPESHAGYPMVREARSHPGSTADGRGARSGGSDTTPKAWLRAWRGQSSCLARPAGWQTKAVSFIRRTAKERAVDGVYGNGEVRACTELARRLGPVGAEILSGTSQ